MEHFSPPTVSILAPHGIGLRSPHLPKVIRERPTIDFFEIHPENYIVDRTALGAVETLRSDYPISLHGVGLSLGSATGIDVGHAARLRDLADRLDPFVVSDHLSWSTVDGLYLNDLLPLPYTEEALDALVRNISFVQETLRRQILIENPSAYLRFTCSDFSEPDFLRALVTRTGCGLLLDVNNVYVSATNLGFDAKAYLDAFPLEHVREIHLSGHARKVTGDGPLLIDDHGSTVCTSVWSLYREVIARIPTAATLIEWDSNLPDLDSLLAESARARAIASNAARPSRQTGLQSLQRQIANYMTSDNDGRDLPIAGYLSVHRNNFRESLLSALRATYCATEMLVGESFFRQVVRQFTTSHPPRGPYVAEFGAEFPDFLDSLESCSSVPYIGDVARLEWIASRASLELPSPALTAKRFIEQAAESPEHVCFAPQAGIFYLASPYPIDALWSFARSGGTGPTPDIENNPVALEIARTENGIVFRRLDCSEFQFRKMLRDGANLATAAEAAVARDPLFDLAASLRFGLRDGIFTNCDIA